MILALVASSSAQPAGYNYRKKFAIQASLVSGTTSLIDFPVLISLTHNDLRTTSNGGGVENPSGFDIVFTAADGSTLLDHELQTYTAADGILIAWLRIPSLSTSVNTEFYLYYGNNSVYTNQSTTVTWSSNYIGVWHLDDLNESTSNGYDFIDYNSASNTGGHIGAAREFDGDGDYLEDLNGNTYLDGLYSYSISLWVKADVTGTDRGLFFGNDPKNIDSRVGMRQDAAGASGGGTNVYRAYMRVDESGTNQKQRTETSDNSQTTSWQYIVMTRSDGNPINVYLDGSFDTPTFTSIYGGPTNGNSKFMLGRGSKDGITSSWDGLIDEVRISNIELSSDWIATDYNSMNSPGTFFLDLNEENVPTLSGIEAVPLSYQSLQAPTIITQSLNVHDYDDLNLDSAYVEITGNFLGAEDVLAFSNSYGITGNWSSTTGILRLTGTTSQADYESAFQAVTYENTNPNPSTLTRTISFRVHDNATFSNTVTRDITLNAVNQAPVLANIESVALDYIDGNPPTSVSAIISISDLDDAYMEGAEIVFTANYVGGEDKLEFATTNGIFGSWNGTTGILTLSGTAATADYQAALRDVQYDNINPDPNTSTRTVSFKINDGADDSNIITRDITVTAANDAPVLSAMESGAINYNAGDGPVNLTATLEVSDGEDTNLDSAIIQIRSNYYIDEDSLGFTDQLGISGTWDKPNGKLTLTGLTSIANYQTALRSIIYENLLSTPHALTRIVDFRVNDGEAFSDTVSRGIASGVPATIADLELWLKADAGVYRDAGSTLSPDGDRVAEWHDQSGYGRNFVDNTAFPTYRASVAGLNGVGGVEFVGTGDNMRDADGENYINGLTEFTIFMVIKSDLTGTDRGFWAVANANSVDKEFSIRYDALGDIGSDPNVIKTAILTNSPVNQIESYAQVQTTEAQLICLDWESGEVYNLLIDGVLNNPASQVSIPASALDNAKKIIIGQGPFDVGTSWDGMIAEVILYGTHISDSDREKVEDYLADKYDISVRLFKAAEGGAEISADDANTTFTTLTGPRITEDVVGELTLNGTIVLNAPGGYEWDTGGGAPSVTVQQSYGLSTTLQVSFIARTSSLLTFTIDQESNAGSQPGEIIFNDLRVRPTTGLLPNTGNITNTGTTGPAGSTNYGTLAIVAGVAAQLVYDQGPSTATQGEVIAPPITVQVQDQNGNDLAEAGISINFTLTTGTGALSGTTTQLTDLDGLGTFNDLNIDQTGIKRLTASSSGLTPIESSDFTIVSDGTFTTFFIEKQSGGNILTQTAGQNFVIKVSAVDGTQTVDTSFNGTVEISSTGSLGSGSGTTTNFTNGVLANHSVNITNTGNFIITATNSSGPEFGTSNSFTVNPGVGDPATTIISVYPEVIENDGVSTATITVQVKDDQGNNLTAGGDLVNLLSTAGTLIGIVTDHGDGTYSQSIRSSVAAQTATITGLLNTQSIADDAQVTFNQYTNIWESSPGNDPYTSEWEDDRNWDTGLAPDATDAVFIPATPAAGTKQPVISVDNLQIKSVVVESGADITLSGGMSFDILEDVLGGGEINGSVLDTLNIGGNISIGTIDLSHIIFNGITTQSITSPTSYLNLTVNNNAGVSSNINLSVTGTLNLTSGLLTIPSGKALIANTKVYGTGKISMEREISGNTGWRLLVAPLVSNYGDFLDAIFTQGYTGSDSATGSPSVLYYDETFTGTDNQRWRKPSADTDVTVPGRGLFTYVFGDIATEPAYSNPLPVILTVDGQEAGLVGGEFDFGITYTTTADSGWNLIGNPFCATINWDEANWVKTNVDNTVYVWDASINSGNGGYLTWNGVTGSLGSGIIPPFQGFWVKANAPAPVLKINQSAKTTGGVFYKQMANPEPVIMFRAENDTLEANTYLMFTADAWRGNDLFDAYRLIPFTNTYVDIYTISEASDQLSINNYPLNFGIPIDIPLDVKAYHDGQSAAVSSSISWPKLANIPADWTVELYDRQERITINLRENSIYTFNEEGVSQVVLPPVTPGKISYSGPLQLKKTQAGHTARFLVKVDPGNSNPDIPRAYALGRNFPNPFNMSTSFPIELPVEGWITLKIINLQGREVTTLIDNQQYRAGIHYFNWSPRQLASGIYFANLVTEKKTFISKMMLIK